MADPYDVAARLKAALQAKQYAGGALERRIPWPGGEPMPPSHSRTESVPDVCPPIQIPSPAVDPTPPKPREDQVCKPLPAELENLVCRMAIKAAQENARYNWNPYQFPTPFSKDFIIEGSNVATAVTPAFFRLARFKVPSGFVGVLESVCVDVPAGLQGLVHVFITVNDQRLENQLSQVFPGAGAVAPVQTPGLAALGGGVEKKVFHALQDEMSVGLEVEVDPAGLALLPATFSGAMRGRYWMPSDATKFWSYNKTD